MTARDNAIAAPSKAEIRAALDRVIKSSNFRTSLQLTSFLRFVVEETLAGRANRIKGYSVAVVALGRSENFDPQSDPIVRVEACRLRRALERYYAGLGRDDEFVIDLPRGSYIPIFRRRRSIRDHPLDLRGNRSILRAAQQRNRLLGFIACVATAFRFVIAALKRTIGGAVTRVSVLPGLYGMVLMVLSVVTVVSITVAWWTGRN
jgi:hypothetical protein